MNGQISQIPGLSPVVIIPPEEKTQRRRGIVKESDSEYIKLAKQGGHKGRASIYSTSYITVKVILPALTYVLCCTDGGQDFCGTRTRSLPVSPSTNLQTGSYLHQSPTVARGTYLRVFVCLSVFHEAPLLSVSFWLKNKCSFIPFTANIFILPVLPLNVSYKWYQGYI